MSAVIAAVLLGAGCGGGADSASAGESDAPASESSSESLPDPADARAKAAAACAAASRAYAAAEPIFNAFASGAQVPQSELDRASDLVIETQELAEEASALDEVWVPVDYLAHYLEVYGTNGHRAFRALIRWCHNAGLVQDL